MADSSANLTKTCPMCGKSIPDQSAVCDFCSEPQPGVFPSDSAWRDGKLLVMRRNAVLPFVCIKSGEPADLWVRCGLNQTWVFPWRQLRLTIQIPLSSGWHFRHRCLTTTSWGLVIAGGCVAVMVPRSAPLIIGVGVAWTTFMTTLLKPVKATELYLWLSGVHPDYLAALKEWPRETTRR